MSGEQQRKPHRDWSGWFIWGGRLVGLFGLWALSTFTVQGFLAAFYLAPTEEGLWWPTGTRIVWWVLFYAAYTGRVQRLMWVEARGSAYSSHIQLWAASHIDADQRIARRLVHWIGGLSCAVQQFRRHGVAMPWWQRIIGRRRDPVLDAPFPIPDEVRDAPTPAAA